MDCVWMTETHRFFWAHPPYEYWNCALWETATVSLPRPPEPLDLRFRQLWVWAVMPCSSVLIHRRFRETNCLLLQGRTVIQTNNKPEANTKEIYVPSSLLITCFAYTSTLNTEAVSYTETSVNLYKTTRYLIQEYSDHRLTMFYFLSLYKICISLDFE